MEHVENPLLERQVQGRDIHRYRPANRRNSAKLLDRDDILSISFLYVRRDCFSAYTSFEPCPGVRACTLENRLLISSLSNTFVELHTFGSSLYLSMSVVQVGHVAEI